MITLHYVGACTRVRISMFISVLSDSICEYACTHLCVCVCVSVCMVYICVRLFALPTRALRDGIGHVSKVESMISK